MNMMRQILQIAQVFLLDSVTLVRTECELVSKYFPLKQSQINNNQFMQLGSSQHNYRERQAAFGCMTYGLRLFSITLYFLSQL